ncbi:MAG: hypothetical protein JO345_34530 [Streptosporangiaceae bacterium]|nr:hypothetical protein [Streptosporangiaceae bacterium]
MTPAEVAITAAFGSSALTGAVSFGVLWLQDRRRRKAADKAALHKAMADLLSRSLAVAMRARAMDEAVKLRSGLSEGVDVALRQRKPADIFELHDWMARDLAPLNEALTEIWTRDNQEGVRLANDLVNKCMALLGASTTAQKPANGWERLRRWAVGVRWTPEMIADSERAMKELAHARKRFADHARNRFGREAVELFTLPESDDEPLALEAPAREANGAAKSLPKG